MTAGTLCSSRRGRVILGSKGTLLRWQAVGVSRRPACRMKVSRENYVRGARMRKIWGEEALDFQEKLLNSSGLGDETYFPDSVPPCAGRWHAFALALLKHVGGVLGGSEVACYIGFF